MLLTAAGDMAQYERRCLTAAPPLPLVLGLSRSDRLPLQVCDAIGSAAGEGKQMRLAYAIESKASRHFKKERTQGELPHTPDCEP